LQQLYPLEPKKIARKGIMFAKTHKLKFLN
jgi:hypothetical protein